MSRHPHHDDTDETDRDDTLTEAFWSLARQLRRASSESLARWDVTPSQFRALRVLARHGQMQLSDLAEHLHIAARSTTEVVDGLEAKGLVGRSADQRDRRVTLVCLTEQGTALAAEIRASHGVEAERLFERLDEADRAHLARILSALRD